MVPTDNLVVPVENPMTHGPIRTGSEDVVTRRRISRLCRPVGLGGAAAGLFALGVAAVFSGSALVARQSDRARPQSLSAKTAVQAAATPVRLAAYGKLPLSFEANRGQVRGAGSGRVKFLARGRGYTLFLEPDEAVVFLRSQESGVRSQESGARIQDSGIRSRKEARDSTALAGGRWGTTTDAGPRTTDVVRLKLVGANRQAKVAGREELPGKSNYFVGRDPARWRTGVPNYRRVKVEGVYPGTDLVYYGRQGELEYDWVLAPGADAGKIELEIETGNGKSETGKSKLENRTSGPSPEARGPNPEKMHVDAQGDLVIATAAGEVRLRKPVAYQEESGVGNQDSGFRSQESEGREVNRQSSIGNRKFLDGRYVLEAGNRVRFEIANYDRSRPLVIDPVLSYSTYLGGSGGGAGYGIAVDGSGNAYVTGTTTSTDFPTLNPFQPANAGEADVFITKLNAAGTALVYSTYLGGSGIDRANAVALDGSGNAYLTGFTQSTDFPTSSGALQTAAGGNGDAFVTKLSADGSTLVYSTYLGGSGADFGQGIAVDSSGSAYVAGSTQSVDFPTAHPLQASNRGGTDAFLAKLSANGSSLVYSTYLGGGGADLGLAVAVDHSGNAYVTGHTSSTNFPTTAGVLQSVPGGGGDAFVTKMNAAGSAYVYSTYLGGSAFDRADAIVVDSSGAAYVTGLTDSSNFPTVSAFQGASAGNGDAFAAKLNPNGSALSYSTYLGGVDAEEGFGIAVDTSGSAFIAGFTSSDNFPVANAIQANFGGGTCSTGPCPDAFVTRLASTGSLLAYSTYLGGNGADYGQAIAVDTSGNAYITGSASSPDFPAIAGALQVVTAGGPKPGDAFISKIALANAPAAGLSPMQLTFAQIPSGTSSAAQTVTLSDYGTAPLTISSIATKGDFTETNNCDGSLAANGTRCTIQVKFQPKAVGTLTGSLTITDSAAGSPHVVSLTGTAGDPAPLVTLSVDTLDFPDTVVGSTSPAQDVKLTNTGSASLVISSIVSGTGNFSQTNDCPGTLNQGLSCTIHVTFTPTKTGGLADSVAVVDNATGSPQNVNLSGNGLAVFALASDPSSVTLNRDATSQNFTVSATAPSTFTDSIQLTCNAVSPTTCSFSPTAITPGQTSTMTLTSFSTGANSSTVGIVGTSGNQTANVNITVLLTNFSLYVSPPVRTIAAGDPATYTVSLLPINGFKQAVSLSCGFFLSSTDAAACTLGSLQATACAISPASLTSDGTSTPAATVKVTTTSQSRGVPPPPREFPRVPLMVLVFLLSTAGLFMAIRRKSPGYTLPLAMALLLLVLSTSCDTTYAPLFQGSVLGKGTPGGLYSVGIVGTGTGQTRCTSANLGVH
jgi:Beta-propeller repeat/HYDIN/CFA65/VesB-like, Ig-like domain